MGSKNKKLMIVGFGKEIFFDSNGFLKVPKMCRSIFERLDVLIKKKKKNEAWEMNDQMFYKMN